MKADMININILSVLLLTIFFGSSQGNNYSIIRNISRFPIQIRVPFEIKIAPKEKSTYSTLVIQVIDQTESYTELIITNIGKNGFKSKHVDGNYFEKPILEKNEETGIIFCKINFTRFAHDKNLEIYILSPNSSEALGKMLDNLKSAKRIYKEQISLLIRSEIELKVNYKIVNEISVENDSVVEASCRSFNGLPKLKPNFVNYSTFNLLSNVFEDDPNIFFLKVKVSIADHGKNLTCQVGNETKSAKINIFHRPTNVVLQPEIRDTVGNNTGIICSVSNGYPIPRIEWTYLEGPPNSIEYYQISPNTQRLFFKKNAPIGSKWRFMCTAKNLIFKNPGTFDKTISFKIIDQKRNLTEYKNSSSYNNTILSQITEINKKLNDLKLKVYSKDLNISSLKNSSYMQRLQIFQLQQSVSKLNDKQQETNEEIISIKKIVNTEIKKLKKEIEKLNGSLSKKNEKNPFEEPKSINQNPLLKPIATFQWKVQRVSYLRRKKKIVRGSQLRNDNIRFSMMVFLQFDDIEYFRLTVHMSPIHNADSLLLIKGYVTITLINSLNSAHQKSMKLFFQRGRKSANVNFLFKYIDLYQNQILQSDDVIIRCSLTIL